jgi:hypothetical protein
MTNETTIKLMKKTPEMEESGEGFYTHSGTVFYNKCDAEDFMKRAMLQFPEIDENRFSIYSTDYSGVKSGCTIAKNYFNQDKTLTTKPKSGSGGAWRWHYAVFATAPLYI